MSKYLITSIEELNQAYLLDPTVWEPLQPELSKTRDTFIKAWSFFELEYSSPEDYEKFSIKLKSYNPHKHQKQFNRSYLDNNLNINDFKDDIETLLKEKEAHYKQTLEDKIYSANTDFVIKKTLKSKIEEINSSISFLSSCTKDKYQKIVSNSYLTSYNSTKEHIYSTYGDYIKPEEKPNNELLKVIRHDKINELIDIEHKLEERDFLSYQHQKLQWKNDKGYKVKLVNFCRLLEHKGFTRSNLPITKIIRFFEKRYDINVGDQAKPSKQKSSLKIIEADFFFIF